MADVIAAGVDASKGYADVCFRNEAGSELWASGRYDDTPAGHQALCQAFAKLAEQHPGTKFRIGVECTGGLERNWLRTFRSLECDKKVYRLSALAVKKFLERDLHRNVTDEISAKGIAAYLLQGLRQADVAYEPEMEGERNLCRHTLNTVARGAQVCNELQSLLPAVHPYLVRYCRKGIPQWVLHLLKEFPTATHLAQAEAAEIAAIRYMKPGHVRKLLKAAQESIAALRDDSTGFVIRELAGQALELAQKVEAQKKLLWQRLKDDAETKILKSIRGIGRWTAVILRLEVGPFGRFHSANAVVAYAGLDPRWRQSGDGVRRLGISHAGKAQIRASLYMPTLTAVRMNPVFTVFYNRLCGEKKPHLVAITACMAKLLRIAYACVVSGQEFDGSRHEQVKAKHEAQRQQQAEADRTRAAAQEDEPAGGASLDAPVSWREAKRRRQRASAKTRVIVCGG